MVAAPERFRGPPAPIPTNNLVAPPLPTSVGIATGATSGFDLAGALKLKPNADDGCQGATFAFKVNLTVASDSSV